MLVASALAASPRLVFTGDVLLAREVRREIDLRGKASPWAGTADFFRGADWVMGNFEGAVGEETDCSGKLCFAVASSYLRFAKDAGFTAFGVENNHAADLGGEGRRATLRSLVANDLRAVTFAASPAFLRKQGYVFSFLAVNNVAGKDGVREEIPSAALGQKIRLAKSLSDWVVVNVHWGAELADWPQPKQREMAAWLVAEGADVVIGHHPHVVQTPECIDGRPVFFSLGNHVFDQKYPQTKEGLLADCAVDSGKLVCRGVGTRTPTNSAFPALKEDTSSPIAFCSVPPGKPVVVDGYTLRPRIAENEFIDGEIVLEGRKEGARPWTVPARRLLSLTRGHLKKGAKDFLFTLETHHSSIDREQSPRPYVYEIGPRGLVAKWRGSALAWPLVDGKLLRTGTLDYLCALHRKDSFIALSPQTKETRTAVYRWNGFGFSGEEDPKIVSQCRSAFSSFSPSS